MAETSIKTPDGTFSAYVAAPKNLAAGKTQANGQATAYVCRGATCSLPITAAAGLSQALAMG